MPGRFLWRLGTVFVKNRTQTPSKKDLFFWFPALLVPYFRDFGSAKKMNKTIRGKLMGLKTVFRNNDLLE
jgi:hypothetical protein